MTDHVRKRTGETYQVTQRLANVKPKRKTDMLQATNLSNNGFRNPPELRENLE